MQRKQAMENLVSISQNFASIGYESYEVLIFEFCKQAVLKLF